MENYTEMNLYSSDANKMQTETNGEISKSFKDNDKDNIKSMYNENNISVNQVMASSCAITSTINSVKPVSADGLQINSQSNLENGKLIRRNNVQPNLQPLLKKPLNNISTTKPLILPAPISDSYSQGTKTNIVTMHSNYATSSVTSQFNNCPQQMAMGIATIQPQHFGYSGISNNRYPYSYSTQQLTLSNGGLGTAVQLMPVMNQNNNQINNSRVQSLPLFMTPIIGAHSGMLFQPIMSQSSNPMQTINLPNSTYSNDYSQGIALQSQPMYTSGIRNTTVITNDYENVLKQDVELNKATIMPTQIVEKSETIINSKINKTQTDIEHAGLIRSNIKHRELIRTQIYRMKPAVEELPPERRTTVLVNPSVTPPIEPPINSLPEITLPEKNQPQIDTVNTDETENHDDTKDQTSTVSCQEIEPIPSEIATPDSPEPVVVVPPEPEPVSNGHIEIRSSTPITLPVKRKLPSPEILNEFENPKKLFKISSFDDKLNSGQKSPGSLFEKLYKDIPERQTSLFSQNNRHSNKLTAVVRPKQRKILVHYLDDLIVFESDEPFPTSNKMQVVKSALRAGNIKLNSQKSKLFTDHFLYANTDDEISPNQQKQKILKTNYNIMVNTKTDSCLEPLSIDIPTTNTTSSCDSVDSSQVRPLSVCSPRSPTPVPLPVKKISKDIQSPKKEIPQLSSPIKEGNVKLTQPPPTLQEFNVHHNIEKPEHINVLNNTTNKNQSPVKQVSPVKLKPQKSGLDRPICEWSVNDVADFVKQTPGCDNYVAMFINHEIDGEALLLLSNENLIQGALNMKIGPALKLCARIEKRKALDPPQR